MRLNCKKCGRNLTSEAIKLLEGKIDKVVCVCEDKVLRDKIAKEFGLFDTKTQYMREFDTFIDKLSRENGLTNY